MFDILYDCISECSHVSMQHTLHNKKSIMAYLPVGGYVQLVVDAWAYHTPIHTIQYTYMYFFLLFFLTVVFRLALCYIFELFYCMSWSEAGRGRFRK